MAVMVPREKWTDDRLDELNEKVDGGFARLEGKMDKDIRDFRGEVIARIDKLDEKFDQKFDRLTVGLLVSVIGIIATHAL